MLIEVRIGDLGDIYTGNTPSKSIEEYYESNDIMFIKPDIMSFNIENITKSNEYISEKARKKARIIPKNSLLVSCIGNIGKLAINSEEAAFNQQINAIVHNDRIISSKYLAYLLKYNQKKMESIANAPVVPIINKTQFSNFEVFIHKDLETQKKVEEVLDKAQFLIDKRKKQIELLDELVKSRFIEMFGDIKRNPYGWESFKLEDLYEIIDGDRGKNYPKQDEFYDSEYCLFLNAGNVTSKGFSFRKNAFITKEKDEVLRKGKLERKDIVVTTRGTVGNIAYYDETVPFENIRINSGMVILRQKKEINHIFFIEYFKNPIVYQSLISGSAQPQMPISSMKNANIYIPPIELQNKFAEFVKQVDKLKFEMENSLKELEDNFNSLMQKAFKGELFN